MPLKVWITQKFRFIPPSPPHLEPEDREQADIRSGGLPARPMGGARWRNGQPAPARGSAGGSSRLAALDVRLGLEHGADRGGIVFGVAAFERRRVHRQGGA